MNLPTFHILPARIPEGIVLNIPERALYLFKRGQFLGRFPVAVGMKGWPTPVGSYDIHMMLEDPVWVTPDEMVRRKRVASAVIPGSKSPLGDRWMGWCEVGPDQSEVGFHGTNDVTSIGKLASHACVRLYPEHAREVYSQAYEGMPVVSLYEPIKVGKQNDSYYLSVSPDIYNRKKVSLSRALQLLKKAGAKKPDAKRIKTLLARQDGYPYLVATK